MSFFTCYELSRGRQLDTFECDEFEHELQQRLGNAKKVAQAKDRRLVGRLRSGHAYLDMAATGFQELNQNLALKAEARARHRDLIEKCPTMNGKAIVVMK